jgi:hypothetical protein
MTKLMGGRAAAAHLVVVCFVFCVVVASGLLAKLKHSTNDTYFVKKVGYQIFLNGQPLHTHKQ